MNFRQMSKSEILRFAQDDVARMTQGADDVRDCLGSISHPDLSLSWSSLAVLAILSCTRHSERSEGSQT